MLCSDQDALPHIMRTGLPYGFVQAVKGDAASPLLATAAGIAQAQAKAWQPSPHSELMLLSILCAILCLLLRCWRGLHLDADILS